MKRQRENDERSKPILKRTHKNMNLEVDLHFEEMLSKSMVDASIVIDNIPVEYWNILCTTSRIYSNLIRTRKSIWEKFNMKSMWERFSETITIKNKQNPITIVRSLIDSTYFFHSLNSAAYISKAVTAFYKYGKLVSITDKYKTDDEYINKTRRVLILLHLERMVKRIM